MCCYFCVDFCVFLAQGSGQQVAGCTCPRTQALLGSPSAAMATDLDAGCREGSAPVSSTGAAKCVGPFLEAMMADDVAGSLETALETDVLQLLATYEKLMSKGDVLSEIFGTEHLQDLATALGVSRPCNAIAEIREAFLLSVEQVELAECAQCAAGDQRVQCSVFSLTEGDDTDDEKYFFQTRPRSLISRPARRCRNHCRAPSGVLPRAQMSSSRRSCRMHILKQPPHLMCS